MIGAKDISLVLHDLLGASYAGAKWTRETPKLEYVLRTPGWILSFCSIRALTNADCRTIFQFHQEFNSKRGLQKHVFKSLQYFGDSSNSRAMGVPNPHYMSKSEILYILSRINKPELVVETGVASGVSSTFILQALEDNGKGFLYSIEISPQIPGGTKHAGWIVPENLRGRWQLIIGASTQKLPSLLEKLGRIGVFLHDSLHTYENMFWEYKTAWLHLTKGGLLLSDDIHWNDAFNHFCMSVDCKGISFGGFGGIRK